MPRDALDAFPKKLNGAKSLREKIAKIYVSNFERIQKTILTGEKNSNILIS